MFSVKIAREFTCIFFHCFKQLLLEVQDIEQMVVLGGKTKSCPYYGARYAIKDAQVRL